MDFSEALLVVIIIMLVIVMCKKGSGQPMQKTWDCVDRDSGKTTVVKMQMPAHPPGCNCSECKRLNPEAMSLKENSEHFSSSESRVDENENYANFESSGSYTDSSQGYKDFITAMSVDPQTLRNHGEFVQDRLNGQNQNVTGRTYAIPEAVEGNDIPWTGLRRPQLIPSVAMGNPTQMSDVRTTNYAVTPTFNWNSSHMSPGQA